MNISKDATNDIEKKASNASPGVSVSCQKKEVQLKIGKDVSLSEDNPSTGSASDSGDAVIKVGDMLGGSSVESIDDHCQNFPTSTWTQFRILFIR